MKKLLCAIIAMLMFLCGCEETEPHDETPVTMSDETLTINRNLQLQYADGCLYALIGYPSYSGNYIVRYNCASGNVSAVCSDPLCFHNTEDCPMVGIVNWNILPDGRVCYSHRFTKGKTEINDLALYDPESGNKSLLYQYGDSYFTGVELFTDNYRFYPSIEYDEEGGLFVCGLYRMELKTGDFTLLEEYSSDDEGHTFNATSVLFGIYGERIYLTDSASIYSMDFNGENRVTHLEGVFPRVIHSDGEFVYYQRGDGIYRRKLSGGEEEQIVDCGNISGQFTLTTNYIYYQAGETITLGKVDIDDYAAKEAELSGGTIYRCRHDGSELTKIAEMSGEYEHLRPTSLTVAGDYIYATYTGWQDKNGDGIFTREEQLASGYGGDHLPILRIDTVSGEITMIDLK